MNKIWLTLVVLLPLLVPGAHAQQSYQKDSEAIGYHYAVIARTMQKGLRSKVIPNMSDEAQDVVEKTHFVADKSLDTNAYATGNDVVFEAGMLQLIEMHAQAFILQGRPGFHQCYAEWLTYFVKGYVSNSTAVKMGRPPGTVYAISGPWPRSSTSSCPTAEQDFALTADEQDLEARDIEASFALIVMHEYGHQALGHTQQPLKAASIAAKECTLTEGELAASRSQESAADRWAVDQLSDAGFAAVAAFPAFVIFAMTAPDTYAHTPCLDHPMGYARSLAIVDEMDVRLHANDEFMAKLAAEGQTKKFWRGVAAAKVALEKAAQDTAGNIANASGKKN